MLPTPSDILGAVMSQKQDVAALFDELRDGSRDGEGVTRDTYGPGEQFAHRLIAERADAMGLETRRDHAANLFMTLPGADRSAPCLMTGSHLELRRQWRQLRRCSRRHRRAGRDQEPATARTAAALRRHDRWQSGPRRASGSRSPTSAAARPSGFCRRERSRPGASTRAARLPSTWRNAAPHIDDVRAGKASLEARSIRACVELHIEQAPQLVEAGIAGCGRHRGSRQLSLSAGEDRGRIRARRSSQAVSARRGAGGERVRRSASTRSGRRATRQAGPWLSPSAASTRTRRSTR